jgi:RHS repeat-associated protein
MKKLTLFLTLAVLGGMPVCGTAAQEQKPLTNADVINMVQAGVPESVVISSIKSRPANFDVSPDALIALHKAGVTQGEMGAMIAAAGTSASNASGAAQPGSTSTAPNPNFPSVSLIQNGSPQTLDLERTQLAQTKTKPTSMATLAGDQAVQQGISTAAWDTAVHTNSGVGGGAVLAGGNVFSGIMSHRKPTVTYVWGVPKPESANVVHTTLPSFSVNYATMPGIKPEDFEPTIVKLTPAQNSLRIVGATQGKEDATSSSAADWEIYSSYLEDRVAVNSQKKGPGDYQISPASPLLPGEYAVVMRPVSKTKKFSGGDVARGQGDGLMFDAVWSFQVAPDATATSNTSSTTNGFLGECQPYSILPCQDQAATVRVPVTGTGLTLVYRSDREPGRKLAPSDTVGSQYLAGWTIDVHHSYDPAANVLLQGDGLRRSVQAIAIRTGKYAGDVAIASEDSSQVFVFDSSGHHLWTLDAIGGAAVWQFSYDGNNRLSAIVNRGGQRIEVQRNANGGLTALIRPDQARISISLNGSGYIESITQPGGAKDEFTYATGGLLSTHRSPRGNTISYMYDSQGLLTNVVRPGGGVISYSREPIGGGVAVHITTAAGRKWTYSEARSGETITRSMKDASGGGTQVTLTANTREASLPDGTRVSLRLGPDPRFGMQAPVLEQQIVTMPSGQREITTRQRTARVNTDPLADVGIEESLTVGNATSTLSYDPASHALSTVDADGIRCSSTLDDHGRATRVECRGQVAELTYDDHGELASITQTANGQRRTLKIGSNTATGEMTLTDPVGNVTTLAADASARPIAVTLPDGGAIRITRDAEGNILGVLPPGSGQFLLTTSPQGLLTSVIGPSAKGPDGVWFSYDADGLLQRVSAGSTSPAAVERDSLGRLTTVDLGNEKLTAAYEGSNPIPSTMTGPSSVSVSRKLDGPLVTSETWRGPVTGTVSRTYDDRRRVTAIDVNGTTLGISYDPAGKVARIGNLAFTYDARTGRINRETLGDLQTAVTYDAFGTLSQLSTSLATNPVDGIVFTRDADGRLIGVKETGRANRTVSYRYDANGRLAAVTQDAKTTTYAYTANGDVASVSGPNGIEKFKYDIGGRLLTAGSTQFEYGAGGTLSARRTPSGVTSYDYDQRGTLNSVRLPGGKQIDYITDALDRRIGRVVNGKLVSGYVWADNQVIAELDAWGKVVSIFGREADGDLAVVVRGGTSYRVLTDPNGSIREIIDPSGKVVERIDYDPWGKVIADTQPGFQPFGFDGGLADPDTGLVRLGARDYDPSIGRFTASDPINFSGGQANLYVYRNDDPINGRDPSGLGGGSLDTSGFSIGFSGIAGVGLTYGLNFQYIEGHGWDVYPYLGYGYGVDLGLSFQGNGGVIHNPRPDPASDWAGGITNNTVNLSIGDWGGSHFEGGGDYGSTWSGYSGGPTFGPIPFGLSQTTTPYSFCLTCALFDWLDSIAKEPNPDFGPNGPDAGLPDPNAPDGGSGSGGGNSGSGNNGPGSGQGSFGGDPHLFSPDGLHFDEQGQGEFLALTSTQHDLEVQVRQQPASENAPVAFSTAIAMNVNGDHVGVYRDLRNGTILIGGKKVPRTPATIRLSHGGVVVIGHDAIVVRWPDGSTVNVTAGYSVDATYRLAPSRRGKVTGLWGSFAGDPSKDLVSRAGVAESLTGRSTPSHEFINSWRIKQSESLFEDMPGKDVAHFTNLAFDTHPATASSMSPEARQRAAEICAATGVTGPSLDDCIFDVGFTGDPSFAITAVRISASRPQVEVAQLPATTTGNTEAASAPKEEPAAGQPEGGSLASSSCGPRRQGTVTGTLQRLDVRTGLWEITQTITLAELPPALQAMADQMTPEQRAKSGLGGTTVHQSCVTSQDLNGNPFDKNCDWTVLDSTSTDMNLRATACSMGKGMTGQMKFKIHVIDSEHATGSGSIAITGNGQTFGGSATYTGKWIGVTCPAELK